VSTYTLADAARILNVSPSRLRYWKRTALVHARIVDGDRPGFDFRDLVHVRAVLALLDQGVPLRRIRRSLEGLRKRAPELPDPLPSLRLWAEGSERMVVQHGDVLLEPDGQMVLDFRVSGAVDLAGADVQSILTSESALKSALNSEPNSKLVDSVESALDWFERGCGLDSEPSTLDGAIEAYERAIELDPAFADAHCNLGAVLYNLGRKPAARHCFERALALEPWHVEAHFNIGNVLEEEGCCEMALRHYQDALQADPLHAELHVNIALVSERLKLERKSRDHWRRYLQLQPEGAWADVARQRTERE
jgi:tetratricopeptide (TPR) repeat protein